MKHCNSCGELKYLTEFSKKSCSKDDHDTQCKYCKSQYQRKYRSTEAGKIASRKGYHLWRINNLEYKAYKEAKRRSNKLKAIPKWANLDKIKEIYETCPEGYHVDHIIPLKGKNVCGLHVENNLRHLPAEENIRKGNKYG